MNRFKIGVRLGLIGAAALIGLVLTVTLALSRLDQSMRTDVADTTREHVETALGVIQSYQRREAAGALAHDVAQREALRAVSGMHYGNDGYFWVQDGEARMLMHGSKPELDGKSMAETRDPNGKYLFRDFATLAREKGEGFDHYYWAKPGHDTPQPKISYVKAFTPWGWVVGSGAYTDDIDASVRAAGLALGLSALAILVALGVLVLVLGRSIVIPVRALTARMGGLARGDTGSGIPGLKRGDEVGDMARALEVFREAAIEKAAADAAKATADAAQKFVVETVSSRMSRMSEGNLDALIEVEFPVEYQLLRDNYNQALAHLRDLIAAVAGATLAIRTGSSEIASASDDLARRTESNAATLEQTSAALSQMEERLRSTADSAGRTALQAEAAVSSVGAGRATADEAVQAMTRVSNSAEGIDSVIEGLDKIAFQTRVLAMNAAVEAGRAGDAGRGFAVVADLVSALAMRSEEEAKRAREQLTETQADIITAVGAVQKVDGSLVRISGNVDQVHQLVATMAEDNRAQSTTISEINVAMNAMDSSTQQNAAMVEEASAAARNLANEVAQLATHTARFKLSGAATPRASAPLHRAPNAAIASSAPKTRVAAITTEDWASF